MNFLRVSHSLTHLRLSTRTFASTTTRAVGTSDLHKKDLIANIAETYELSRTQSEKIINTIFDSIVEGVSDGKAVKVSGFGTFETFASKARTGVNPNTRQPLAIPSRRRIRFKPFKAFKEIVDPSLKKEKQTNEEAEE